MKKFALFLMLSVSLMVVNAQTAFKQTASNPTGAITNASADTMNVVLSQAYRTVSIQPVVVKASGTAAGTATLYISVDGTNFVATGDALSLTNVTTNTAVWSITKPAKYYRIIVAGGTTVTETCSAKIIQGQ